MELILVDTDVLIDYKRTKEQSWFVNLFAIGNQRHFSRVAGLTLLAE